MAARLLDIFAGLCLLVFIDGGLCWQRLFPPSWGYRESRGRWPHVPQVISWCMAGGSWRAIPCSSGLAPPLCLSPPFPASSVGPLPLLALPVLRKEEPTPPSQGGPTVQPFLVSNSQLSWRAEAVWGQRRPRYYLRIHLLSRLLFILRRLCCSFPCSCNTPQVFTEVEALG